MKLITNLYEKDNFVEVGETEVRWHNFHNFDIRLFKQLIIIINVPHNRKNCTDREKRFLYIFMPRMILYII